MKVLTEKQHHQAAKNEYNFDHPDGFDFELLRKTLQRLKHFKSVEVPIYNFITHSRETKTVYFLIIDIIRMHSNIFLHYSIENNVWSQCDYIRGHFDVLQPGNLFCK